MFLKLLIFHLINLHKLHSCNQISVTIPSFFTLKSVNKRITQLKVVFNIEKNLFKEKISTFIRKVTSFIASSSAIKRHRDEQPNNWKYYYYIFSNPEKQTKGVINFSGSIIRRKEEEISFMNCNKAKKGRYQVFLWNIS